MNRDYMANMYFNIVDVIETLEYHSINQDMIDDYDESQFKSEAIRLTDLPKDFEGSQATIGELLHDLRQDIMRLEDYFSGDFQMTYDSEHYYAVQTFLEDDELCKIWNIIEIAMNREGYDVSNAELSMRLFDSELTENVEHDMENLL